MSRKLFGGQLKDPIGFVVGLSIISLSAIFMGIFLICVAISGNYTNGNPTIIGMFSALAILLGIGHPILFVHVVKNRKRYPRLSKWLVKPGYFVDE